MEPLGSRVLPRLSRSALEGCSSVPSLDDVHQESQRRAVAFRLRSHVLQAGVPTADHARLYGRLPGLDREG